MNTYEQLEAEACANGIDVVDYEFQSDRIKGLYCDGTIGLNKNIVTTAEKSCVLAEEMGHHYTTAGNIIDQDNAGNCKQERRARLWAYNKKIGLLGLVGAYENGCQSREEIAEYLEVSEEFLCQAIDCYREKYGIYTTIDNYAIYFMPSLTIAKVL